jgi:hypothetical protein
MLFVHEANCRKMPFGTVTDKNSSGSEGDGETFKKKARIS